MTWSGSAWFPVLLPIGPPQNTANTEVKGRLIVGGGNPTGWRERTREREHVCGEAGPIRLLQGGRDMGAENPARVGWSRLVVGPLGHLTSSKLDWVLERPSLVYRVVVGPEPKTVSGP